MVRGRRKPLELLFNLEHPEHLAVVTEVNEEADDDDESPDDEDTDSSDDELQEQSRKAGCDVDLGLHLRSLVAFATNQSPFLTIGNVPIERLQEAWKHCVPGIEYAIDFLKSNAGIDSPALLSSPYLLVTLGYFGHARRYTIGRNEAAALRKWALLANAKGRYTRGSSETLLDQDLATIRDGGSVPELLERLRLQVGRLDIVLAIALDHRGVTHKLQFHHIFPKALLSGHYTPGEADDIANLAFISGKTNKQILAKPPKAYFPQYIEKAGEEAFAAQCIPTNDMLLDLTDSKAFLAERRIMISKRLNQYLDCVAGNC